MISLLQASSEVTANIARLHHSIGRDRIRIDFVRQILLGSRTHRATRNPWQRHNVKQGHARRGKKKIYSGGCFLLRKGNVPRSKILQCNTDVSAGAFFNPSATTKIAPFKRKKKHRSPDQEENVFFHVRVCVSQNQLASSKLSIVGAGTEIGVIYATGKRGQNVSQMEDLNSLWIDGEISAAANATQIALEEVLFRCKQAVVEDWKAVRVVRRLLHRKGL